MKILVIFASHRMGGKNADIENAMCRYQDNFDFDFVHLAKHKIEGCIDCHCCEQNEYCILPPSDNDCFQEIFDKMQMSDVIFIISPVYTSIPSRLAALFERLTSVLFYTGKMNTDQNPLLNKRAAVFSYCSAGICDDASVKLICDKFFIKGYRFDRSTYNYLNLLPDPRAQYNDIIDYVIDTLESLKQ